MSRQLYIHIIKIEPRIAQTNWAHYKNQIWTAISCCRCMQPADKFVLKTIYILNQNLEMLFQTVGVY